jgi:hypothetical protein
VLLTLEKMRESNNTVSDHACKSRENPRHSFASAAGSSPSLVHAFISHLKSVRPFGVFLKALQ